MAADEKALFDEADWYWRTMDPDDSGDSPNEALNRGMVGNFTVCEVASSFTGPTRYGFTAPVLDPESDDEEFLHFATQEEAMIAAGERLAAVKKLKGDTGVRRSAGITQDLTWRRYLRTESRKPDTNEVLHGRLPGED